jgi:hypothetical protein
MIFLAAIYFAMSLPESAPLQWWGPLSRTECEAIERATSGAWCHKIEVPVRDRRCSGSARYEAMRDGDLSGYGTGHVCLKKQK